MRQFFRITLRVLILVAVFLASALTAMRLAIHGREVAVPKITGMSDADAQRTALDNGLFLEVENRFFSADVPDGRILSQVPSAGEKVRRGTRVRVGVSLGPQKVVIPAVVGQSQRAAEINIGRRGLEVGTVAVTSLPGVTPDQVIAQSPLPDAAGVSPKINLLISAPPDANSDLYLMPDFVGHTLDDASRAIAESPMKFGKVTSQRNGNKGTTGAVGGSPVVNPANGIGASSNSGESKSSPQKGSPVIVKQAPAAGQKVPPGTLINFDIVR